MLRRLRKLLDILPSDEIHPFWSQLPTEIRREIIKHTDLQTRCSLRLCSKIDKAVVDSLPINIPFVHLETSDKEFKMVICENSEKVSVVKVSKKLRRSLVEIKDSLFGEPWRSSKKRIDFDCIITSILNILRLPNVTIGTLNIEVQKLFEPILEFLVEKRVRVTSTSWNMTSLFMIPRVTIESTKLFNLDASKDDYFQRPGSMRMVMGFHKEFPDQIIEYATMTMLRSNVGALIASVLWRYQSPKTFYWIPNYEFPEEERVELARRYEAEFEECSGVFNISISCQDGRMLMVKISGCGVSLQKVSEEEIEFFDKTSCGLSWMCAKCDCSLESWYHRTQLEIIP